MCHETHVKYGGKEDVARQESRQQLLAKRSLLSKKEHRNWVPFSPGQAKNELSDLVKLKSTESTERVREGMNVVQLIFSNSTTKLGGKRRCCVVEHGENE